MDIQQAIAPAAVKPQASDKTDKADKADKTQDSKDSKDSKLQAADFSQLLQGLQTVEAMPDASLVEAPALPVPDGALGAELPLQMPVLEKPLLDSATADIEAGASVVWDAESLIGQTRSMDAVDMDAALQNGSFLLTQQNAAGAGLRSEGARPQVAVGEQVSTVAAGVQTLAASLLGKESLAAPVAAATTVLSQASELAQSVAQAVSEAVGTAAEDVKEGRVALQGAWKLDDASMQLNPAMQRLAGQVEQWAAAVAGLQPRAQERADGSKTAPAGIQWLSTGHGSGTQLMENAVQEAQQAQDAALESQPEAPVEDMRFWLQGRQQRAEVLMDKDGQPVRVQITLRGNEAHVSFRADQAQTRDMLDASLQQLRDMLQQQGVELAGVSVEADAQGGAQQQAQHPRMPWDTAVVQHAQVAVPVEGAAAQRPVAAQGLSLYA